RLLEEVAPTLEARRACFLVGGHPCLVLLRRGLLLLLPLRRVLPAALTPRRNRSRCCSCPRVPAADLADDRTSSRAANTRSRCCAGGCRGRLCSSRRWRRLGGIVL